MQMFIGLGPAAPPIFAKTKSVNYESFLASFNSFTHNLISKVLKCDVGVIYLFTFSVAKKNGIRDDDDPDISPPYHPRCHPAGRGSKYQ